jgi:ABC-type sugar transport system ATPase subunit
MVKVVLDGITKRFDGVEVLRDISLDVQDGAFVAFVGPSGCGKSTLLRVIAGLETADEGSVLFDGRRMNEVPAPDRGTAMVFQSYALYPHMTVWENISFSLRIKGIDKTERRAQAAKVAELLQLSDYLERRPANLSGGQRQRVAIGRALLRNPGVFLFDEPLSNLDAALRSEMRVELAKLHQRLGNTMIYVTHDQVEAMTMANTIVVLNRGRVVQVGAPMELYARPATRFVAEFIGAPKMNILEGIVGDRTDRTMEVHFAEGARVDVPSCRVPSGSPVAVGIRPEDVRITPEGSGGAALMAEVEVVERLGDVALLYCRSTLPDRVVAKTAGTTEIKVGDRIGMAFPAESAHVFNEQGDRLTVGQDPSSTV